METVLRELKYPIALFGQALIVIVVAWTVIAVVRTRRQTIQAATTISVVEALLAAGVVAIVAFTIVPLRIPMADQYQPPPGINWEPVVPVLQGLLSQEGDIAAFNAIGNLALYVPLGAAVTWRLGMSRRNVLVLALLVSVAIEAWQVVAPDQRSADVNDVLLNVIGALGGAVGMSLVLRLAPGLAIRAQPSGSSEPATDNPRA